MASITEPSSGPDMEKGTTGKWLPKPGTSRIDLTPGWLKPTEVRVDLWHCSECGHVILQEPGRAPRNWSAVHDAGSPLSCPQCLGGGIMILRGQLLLHGFKEPA
jgi:hypothetical protein